MSSKRQLIFDDVVLKALFLLEEEDEENRELANRLKKSVIYTDLMANNLIIHFINQVVILVTKYNEFYHLRVISYPERVYDEEDNQNTKMSIDRIIYYFNKIMRIE